MSPSRPGCVMHKSQVISWQRDSRHRCPAWLNLSTTIGPSQAARSPALSHGRDRWNGVSSWFTAPMESPAAWRPRSASAAWFTAALGQPARAGGMPLPESSPRLKCWPHLHLLGERISTRGVLTANVSSGGSQVLGGGAEPCSFGLSALALGMYFGVSARLHLLSQKQGWSGPRELQPQGTSILNLPSPSSPWAGQGCWHWGQGKVHWEAPMPREVRILWGRGRGWLRTR